MRNAVEGIGIFILAAIIAGTIILVVSRRTHLLNWKFGIFFESEEHWTEKDEKGDNDA